MLVMFIKSNPMRDDILVVNPNEITGFEESGKGVDITFNNKDTYYFSLDDAEYLVNKIFQKKTKKESN